MGNTQSNSEKENNQVNGNEKSPSNKSEKDNSNEFLDIFLSCCGTANKRNLKVSDSNKKSKNNKKTREKAREKKKSICEKYEENGFHNSSLKDKYLDYNSSLNDEHKDSYSKLNEETIQIIKGNFD